MRAGLVLALLAFSAALPAEEIRPGVPAELYVAPGRATTVLFHAPEKIAAISLASPIVTYKYDRALNQLEITPAVRRGGMETNLNLRIGEGIYVLLVEVVEDSRVQYLREFTPAGDRAPDDEAAVGRAPALAPAEVDVTGAVQTWVRAEADPVFRSAHPLLRIEPIGRELAWGDGRLRLAAVAQFIDQDLLLFRVQWEPGAAGMGPPDPRLCRLTAAGRPVPVTARYRADDALYLAVQGYRLSRHNAWDLALPPP